MKGPPFFLFNLLLVKFKQKINKYREKTELSSKIGSSGQEEG